MNNCGLWERPTLEKDFMKDCILCEGHPMGGIPPC